MKNAWTLALCLGMSVSAHAGNVYKCNQNGSTVYQSRPCPGVTTDAAFKKQNDNSQTTISRQYQQAQRQQIEKQQNAQQQTKQAIANNGTSNQIPDTAEGKKQSLAIAQEAYQQTKNR